MAQATSTPNHPRRCECANQIASITSAKSFSKRTSSGDGSDQSPEPAESSEVWVTDGSWLRLVLGDSENLERAKFGSDAATNRFDDWSKAGVGGGVESTAHTCRAVGGGESPEVTVV
jgi:hypothetical protein